MRTRTFRRPPTLHLRHHYSHPGLERETERETEEETGEKTSKKQHAVPVDDLSTIEAKDCQRRLIVSDLKKHVLQIATWMMLIEEEIKDSLLPTRVEEDYAAAQCGSISEHALELYSQTPKQDQRVDYYLTLLAWGNEFCPVVRDLVDGVDRLRNLKYGTFAAEEALRNDSDLELLRESMEELNMFWNEDRQVKYMCCQAPIAVRE